VSGDYLSRLNLIPIWSEIMDENTEVPEEEAIPPVEASSEESDPSQETEPDNDAEKEQEAPSAPDEEDVQAVKDRLLRARAEFDNFRKRTQRDLTEARANSQIQTVLEFATVMDNFQLAMMAVETSDDISALKAGMRMIHNEFDRAFERMGIDTLEPEGETFDPSIHEALQTENCEDTDEGTILRVIKRGYQLKDRLIRPACVVVSSGTAADQDEK